MLMYVRISRNSVANNLTQTWSNEKRRIKKEPNLVSKVWQDRYIHKRTIGKVEKKKREKKRHYQ